MELEARLEAAKARVRKLEEAAALRRNALICEREGLVGDWVAVPREDFDRLREVLETKP